MKQLFIYILLLSNLGLFAQQKANLSYDQNYIRTKTYLYQENGEYTDRIDYFDGLGRPMQSVQRAITPNQNDLVTYQEYDAFGREAQSWLPGIAESNSGAYIPLDVFKQKAMNSYASDSAYSRPVYEASPLNRVLEQYGSGADWYAKKKAVRTAFLTNITTGDSLSCIRYTVTDVADSISLSKEGMYEAGTLYVTRMLDEDGNRAYEFKDKLGQVVLTRQMNGNEPLDTYYIYDDFGNKRLVLPPLASDQLKQGINNMPVKDYAYIYKYDSRNRCIAKKLPGADWTRYVYDRADRLIFSQDGEQRIKREWLYTIPDVFGRIVMTGICKDTDMQLAITNGNYEQIILKADYNKNNTAKDISDSYTLSQPIFKSGIPGILTVNYYDSYDFLALNGFSKLTYNPAKETEGYGKRSTERYTTLLTGTVTALFDSPDSYLYSAMYYDHRKRLIQAKSTNHLKGMEEEYLAYNYTGQPVKRQHIHTAEGKDDQNEIYTYDYDHAGRLETTTHQLNAGNIVTLASNSYDELGRLESVARNGQAKLTASYGYNVRGWTKSISSPLFTQSLSYNEADGANKPQYGGNISAMSWTVSGDKQRGYAFSYDNLSRLTDAGYLENGAVPINAINPYQAPSYKTAYTYDKHGNMETLQRYGQNTSATYGLIDSLTMVYTGNQMLKAEDTIDDISLAESADFKNYSNVATEYFYNANGAMVKDLNKGISDIQYNSLNLPRIVDIKNPVAEARNEYIYTANGKKLRVVQKWNSDYSTAPVIGSDVNLAALDKVETTDYAGNIIYESRSDGTSKTRILIQGGYIDDGKYYFYLTDHLGNNRVVAKADGAIIQRNHYYPFGMAFAETSLEEQQLQPYKYNGKELDQLHGLNWYDYSARYYDPGINRIPTQDPLAEKYYSVSPYAYTLNNPIRFIDPDGREVGVPEWIRGYAIGAWSAGAGMVTGIVSANPVSAAQTAVGEAGKVVNAYQSGGVGAAAEQYATSVYETSGAQALVQTAQGVANGNPEAIGAAATTIAAAVLTHKVTAGTSGQTVNTESMTTVGRWMSKTEYKTLSSTQQMVEGAGGKTSVAKGGGESFKGAAKGSVYAEFDVPTNSLVQGGKTNWYSVIGPNANKVMKATVQKQGGLLLNEFQIKNLTPILQSK